MHYGVPPSIEPSQSKPIFSPPSEGEGYWAGAPCVHTHGGVTYLAVRERTPDQRGRSLIVTERVGPYEYEPVIELTAADLGVNSIERPALTTDIETGALKLYLSVDHGRNDWTIQKLDDVSSPADFDTSTARDVLSPDPGTTDEQTVKDPLLITLGGRYFMFYAGHDGRSEQAHLAISHDGEQWSKAPENPILPSQNWHDHHTRISCVLPAENAPFWLVFYDGSGVREYRREWNLKTGVAISHNLRDITDTSPNGPRYSSHASDQGVGAEQFGTFRYLDILRDGEKAVMYYEAAAADGSYDLWEASVEVDGY